MTSVDKATTVTRRGRVGDLSTRRGGGNTWEKLQSQTVARKAKQIMDDASSPQVGRVSAQNYIRDAEDRKMSISSSKNREDPMGYAKGGVVHVPKSAATMRGKARS